MAKVGVLIHGRHLEAKGWEHIVWGDPRVLRGQVPKGIAQALLHSAELIYWGTGASKKDGKRESQYTFDYTMGRLGELAPMHVSDRVHSSYTTYSRAELAAYLHEVSYIDTVTQNTTEEIKGALSECERRGIQKLYLVSSPSHIARCLQEALKILSVRRGQVLVYATASDTCFVDSTPGDVTILEPPHRGDDPMIKVEPQFFPSNIAKRFFKLPFDQRVELMTELDGRLPT